VPDLGGLLKTFHYSISNIKGTPGFRPREADERLGYFTTTYRGPGQVRPQRRQHVTRYINRWHIEKADPKLKMSPPKEPIVYYVEHTVPVRYRRYRP
jgi:ribosomal protein S7